MKPTLKQLRDFWIAATISAVLAAAGAFGALCTRSPILEENRAWSSFKEPPQTLTEPPDWLRPSHPSRVVGALAGDRDVMHMAFA